MTPKTKAIVSWSSGKDSALALARVLAGPYEVVGLVTSLSEEESRVTLHGTRESLLEAQSESLGIPLEKIRLPFPATNLEFEGKWIPELLKQRDRGVTHVVFGDLFLEDIRTYRENLLRGTGLTAVFPLWGESTNSIAKEILAKSFRAKLTSVDLTKLSPDFAGREFDESLLRDLPRGVDPCGENGEFHTFVYDGPLFAHRLPLSVGRTVTKNGFAYTDLILGDAR